MEWLRPMQISIWDDVFSSFGSFKVMKLKDGIERHAYPREGKSQLLTQKAINQLI